MAQIYFKNISDEINEADLAALIATGKVKAVSPTLEPGKAGVPDYKFVNGAREVVKDDAEAIVFFDPTVAFFADNTPTTKFTLSDGTVVTGVAIRIPVYQREQYVTLLPSEDITIETEDAIATKFYNDVFAAFTATEFGKLVVTDKEDVSN